MLYEFEDLLAAYATHPVTWLKEAGPDEEYRDYEDGGKLKKPEPEEIELKNSVITALGEDDLKYEWGGTHYEESRKLYTYHRIPKGQKVIYKGKDYTIGRSRDYSDFTTEYDPNNPDQEGLVLYELIRSDKE